MKNAKFESFISINFQDEADEPLLSGIAREHWVVQFHIWFWYKQKIASDSKAFGPYMNELSIVGKSLLHFQILHEEHFY